MGDDDSRTAGWFDSLVEPADEATLAEGESTGPGATALPARGPRSARYTDLGLLARGGMGEVRRVHDTLLGRPAVMKIMHPHLALRRRSRARFLAEVRITARLQHPGIVPVQEAGELSDGRLWFTMKEVAGRTLHAIADEFHRALDYGADSTADGWNLRRLIDVLRRVAQTLAYAHREGVVHRDIKPENLMVGAFGEVMVMDWGIAYDRRRPPDIEPPEAGDAERTGVVGTPSYMAPEQALGQAPSPATDVYALGGVLFTLLTGSRPIDTRGDSKAVIHTRPRPVADAVPDHLEVPALLAELCDRALSADAARRPADAGAFEATLRAWLDGEARRARAEALIRSARDLMPRTAALRARAETLAREAADRLAPVAPHAPIAQKRPGWQLESEAEAIRQRARRVQLAVAQTLRQALEADPDSREARELLSRHYREQVLDAEKRGDHQAAADAAETLRLHDEAGNAEWLRGDGALTLVTDPPEATATLFRFVERDRRLVPEKVRRLPATPIEALPLARGSYVIVLQAPGRADVLYPVHIDRNRHWHGRPPGGGQPHPVLLPPADALGPDDVYVPPGWCRLGGDPEASDPLPGHERWIDGFVMRRFPVTHGEYIEFLDALVAAGDEAAALQHMPSGGPAGALYARDADGRFHVQRAVDIDWTPDMPVMRITWRSAVAYAAWYAARTGQPWRLPEDVEWEKAARGVDGRLYPMGDYLDPTWACMLTSHAERPRPAVIGEFGSDRSPYGIAWLAGNASAFCQTPYRRFGTSTDAEPTPADDRFRIVRGGWFVARAHACRAAQRLAVRPDVLTPTVGIRLVRSLPPG